MNYFISFLDEERFLSTTNEGIARQCLKQAEKLVTIPKWYSKSLKLLCADKHIRIEEKLYDISLDVANFTDSLWRHDHYYAMSDDPRAYRSGQVSKEKLIKVLRDCRPSDLTMITEAFHAAGYDPYNHGFYRSFGKRYFEGFFEPAEIYIPDQGYTYMYGEPSQKIEDDEHFFI